MPAAAGNGHWGHWVLPKSWDASWLLGCGRSSARLSCKHEPAAVVVVPQQERFQAPALDPPFAWVPSDYVRGSHWAKPRLVAEIAHSNGTTDGMMRHPKFLGPREDKESREVRLESARK
jgi:hypothetical protein